MPGGASPRRADSENNENRTMKIKSIRTHILQAALSQPFAYRMVPG
jgi:hypothetical protein